VTDGVGDRFGDDAEGCHLHRRGQRRKLADRQVDRQRRAGGQPLGHLGEGAGEPELVQGGGAGPQRLRRTSSMVSLVKVRKLDVVEELRLHDESGPG
jgi:hypothetical protein